jgi:hypothetical protein
MSGPIIEPVPSRLQDEALPLKPSYFVVFMQLRQQMPYVHSKVLRIYYIYALTSIHLLNMYSGFFHELVG